MNRLILLLLGCSLISFAQAPTGSIPVATFNLDNILYVDGVKYACSDVGINAAISALGAIGGTVDASACTSAGPIASTIIVGANTTVSSRGVKLILPCTSNEWLVTVTGGSHVFEIADRSELVGCALRASSIFVQSSANIADVISFLPNPGNGNITEFGKVSNVWVENDNSGAKITNGLLNLQNAYDSVVQDIHLAGFAPCLLYAADTNGGAIAPNADDIENATLDGLGDTGTQLVCIKASNGATLGPIHFRGGDWGHPGYSKSAVVISRSGSGTGHSYGISISDLYMESNKSDTTAPLIAASDTSSFSLNNVFINRLNALSTAACLSLSDTVGQTSAISIRNFTCTGGSNNNAISSSIPGAPSLSVSQVTNYFAPGTLGLAANTAYSAGQVNVTPSLSVNGNILVSASAPSISSGFGTNPSVTASNGTAAFRISVGTGGTASSGIIGLPTAMNGWNCSVNDLTAAEANMAYNTRETASTATSVTLQNQIMSTGAPAAWAASDILAASCFAY